MIITEQIELKKTNDLTSEYIEEELKNLDITPLRWAIVDVNDCVYTLSVSYEK